MINNRQAGRRRGRGGNPGSNGQGQGQGQGQRQGGNAGRDNGNRIDSRARGNASQLYEKYKSLASDAQRQGDRVNIEYYLQFADHYFRVLSEQRGRFDEQPRRGRDDFDGDGDGDEEYGDEGEVVRGNEQGEAIRGEGRSDGRGDARADTRGDYRQDGRAEPRGEGQREPRREQADGDRVRPHVDGARDGAPVDRDQPDRDQPRRARSDRDQSGRSQADRPRVDRAQPDGFQEASSRNSPEERPDRMERGARQAPVEPVEVAGQRRADPPVAGESLEARANAVLDADAPLPRRRGRPRRVDADTERGGDTGGGAEPAPVFEADRLPPSLISSSDDAAGQSDASDNADAKPRRRRTRSPASEAPAAE